MLPWCSRVATICNWEIRCIRITMNSMMKGQAMYGIGSFGSCLSLEGFAAEENVAETHAGLDHSTRRAEVAPKAGSFVLILHCVRVTGVQSSIG